MRRRGRPMYPQEALLKCGCRMYIMFYEGEEPRIGNFVQACSMKAHQAIQKKLAKQAAKEEAAFEDFMKDAPA